MLKEYFLKRKIAKLKDAKIQAVKNKNFELAVDFRAQEKDLITQLEQIARRNKLKQNGGT